MKVTYLGTTVLLFDDGKDQILFDAHITRPAITSMLTGKFRTDTAMADRLIHQFKIHRLKGIFVSHSHFDHVLDAPYFSKKCKTPVYGSPSTLQVARGGDVPESMLHSYEESMDYTIGDFRIQVLPSIHSKAHWYNNDLGQTIDQPVRQPAGKKAYKEGGSFDFLVKHREKTYLIRPSFNYIPGQLDGIRADVLFLGVAGIAKADEKTKRRFFQETVEKVQPELVLPLHWDNFFIPLNKPRYHMPSFIEKTEKVLFELAAYCSRHDVPCLVQLPLTTMNL